MNKLAWNPGRRSQTDMKYGLRFRGDVCEGRMWHPRPMGEACWAWCRPTAGAGRRAGTVGAPQCALLVGIVCCRLPSTCVLLSLSKGLSPHVCPRPTHRRETVTLRAISKTEKTRYVWGGGGVV